jgi:hypothetical protein
MLLDARYATRPRSSVLLAYAGAQQRAKQRPQRREERLAFRVPDERDAHHAAGLAIATRQRELERRENAIELVRRERALAASLANASARAGEDLAHEGVGDQGSVRCDVARVGRAQSFEPAQSLSASSALPTTRSRERKFIML